MAWAAGTGRPVVPLYVHETDGPEAESPGSASRWWLRESLGGLSRSLQARGSRLVVRSGAPEAVLEDVVSATGASALVWNRLYEPGAIARDAAIGRWAKEAGIDVRSFNAALLHEPWTVETGSGSPYRVFAPFWKRCLQLDVETPVPAPRAIPAPRFWPPSVEIGNLGFSSIASGRAESLREAWAPGEEAACRRLSEFVDSLVSVYAGERDRPAKPATSRLSPHLHFGEIGPRQIVAALSTAEPGEGVESFHRELGWREFGHHLLFHNPAMATTALRREFDRMPWRDDPDALRAWRRGVTGYPLVDAGMRELRSTGWMHNRARMVAASFLVKHLLIDWRLGAARFLDALVDADLANNSANWQWVAGCGADAAPYFRIFNPVAQSRRFDPGGVYLRRWVPELAGLDDREIHEPWRAPRSSLKAAGIELGTTYPHPIVDHAAARQRALGAYRDHIRTGTGG